jgi:NAD(P)-dependent dehydrogenase (short-subunit alcohol dehydrogenase family)
MSSLNDKVAIVTGASGGIGRAIAERLAREGATVVVSYGKSAGNATAVVADIESNGGKAVAMQADMGDAGDARRLVRETMQRFGRLDILVNNAGISLNRPLVETTEQEYDQLFAVNGSGGSVNDDATGRNASSAPPSARKTGYGAPTRRAPLARITAATNRPRSCSSSLISPDLAIHCPNRSKRYASSGPASPS